MNADEHPHSIAFHYALTTMDVKKDGERSGFSTPIRPISNSHACTSLTFTASPDVPQTPATSHKLKRSASQETLATTMSEVSSTPSLAYPGAPANTPATQSLAGGDVGDAMIMSMAADIEIAADRLLRTSSSPPTSPSSTGGGKADDDDDNNEEDPFKEGKAHLRATLREASPLRPQLFKSPTPQRTPRKHDVLKKFVLGPLAGEGEGEEDRSRTPTHLSFVTKAASSSSSPTPAPPTSATTATATFEHSAWSSVAEEDTQRALKRMAMLAHDEYVKDPRRSVQEYYSVRLAKLIEEAEVAFDAAHLQ